MDNQAVAERFLRLVSEEPNSGCWLWLGCTDPKGYGHFRLNGSICKAHRVAYELFVGPIPFGLQLDHLCRVKGCVNPAHLEAVTNSENQRRTRGRRPLWGLAAIEAKRTHCPQGHPYSESNTYRWRRQRRCRECNRLQAQKQRRKGKATCLTHDISR